MHIYFSGIGGTGIGPLALIAKQAGYDVSGSDASNSQYVEYLSSKGINIFIGQNEQTIEGVNRSNPINWFVYSSALKPDHPELTYCQQNNIKATKRDELINQILADKNLKMIAVAGTHGKTTTTAMAIWLFKQLGMTISYSVGAKLSFADMGAYEAGSEYFIYEADEFDRNFLAFKPYLSLITGIDWDHPDIYPTQDEYNQAFSEFIGQSSNAVGWEDDFKKLNLPIADNLLSLDKSKENIKSITLAGAVNRQNAFLVAAGISKMMNLSVDEMIDHLNKFPGLSRRFEELSPGLYTDYAHTPPKIAGALQLAQEVAGDSVVVVYEGLHNTRQHFIAKQLRDLFSNVKQLYIVPSYLARENQSLKLLSPADLKSLLSHDTQVKTEPLLLNNELKSRIDKHLASGDLVLCLSAGGSGSLDEWLRQNYQSPKD